MIDLLRRLIYEELGRDLESPRPDPLDWKSYPGIHVMISANPVENCYIAQVKVDGDDSLSTPARKFKTEQDAMFWARSKSDAAYKKLLSNPDYDPNEPKFT
jgi:hypothetical protein